MTRTRKPLAALGAGAAAIVAIVAARTASLASRQPAVEPAADVALDAAAAAQRLAGALRFRTISYQDSMLFDVAEFRRFHGYLERTFPRVHARLPRERVGGHSLLFRWAGRDTTLKPLVLLAHQDVVPVEPGTEGSWTHGAFSGDIADGYVWGRGALDDKGNLVAIFEAVEALLGEGFEPGRTVYLAFGHDEEVGGGRGARAVAALLAERGIEPEFLLDEGGAVTEGLLPGLSAPVAIVGVAEKGYVTLELTTKIAGGHSSMPPDETAVGILSRAVERLQTRQFPRDIRGATAAMLDYLAPELPLAGRVALANRWLFGGLIERRMGATPPGNALLRTTTAPTIFQAGVKENVLPSSARAVVNFRVLPGDSVAGVVAHVNEVVGDPRVEVRVLGPTVAEPSPVSDIASPDFALLLRTIRQVVPDAVVAPWLVVGATDARHFTGLTLDVYRFGAARLGPGDLRRAHGTDERVGVENYGEMVRFFVQLLRNAAG